MGPWPIERSNTTSGIERCLHANGYSGGNDGTQVFAAYQKRKAMRHDQWRSFNWTRSSIWSRLEYAASGALTRDLYERRFSSLLGLRLAIEEVLSLHMAQAPWALVAGAWSSLMLPLVYDVLERPVCVLSVRAPDESMRLQQQSMHLPSSLALALWETQILLSLHACAHVRKVILPHDANCNGGSAFQTLHPWCGHAQSIWPPGATEARSTVRLPLSMLELYSSLANGTAQAWTTDQIPKPTSPKRLGPTGQAMRHTDVVQEWMAWLDEQTGLHKPGTEEANLSKRVRKASKRPLPWPFDDGTYA